MIKRCMDLTGAALGLLVLAPMLLVVAVLVRLTSKGPALFRQERVGLGGRPLTIYKFRSMTVPTALGEGPEITVGGDARVTPLGALLRKSKIDELPQLWNVLRGDMSLVGPRPEVPRYVSRYSPEQRRVLEVKPGMTCLSSLEMLDEERLLAESSDPERFYVESVMPRKLSIACRYAREANPWTDLGVIAATVNRLLKGVLRSAPLSRPAPSER